jgi:hypothetical protein
MARSPTVFLKPATSALEFLVSFCLQAAAKIVPKFQVVAPCFWCSTAHLSLSELIVLL